MIRMNKQIALLNEQNRIVTLLYYLPVKKIQKCLL